MSPAAAFGVLSRVYALFPALGVLGNVTRSPVGAAWSRSVGALTHAYYCELAVVPGDALRRLAGALRHVQADEQTRARALRIARRIERGTAGVASKGARS